MAVFSQTYFSKLSGINRIDSEYFDPEYLELEKILSRVNTVPITAVTNVSDGNHMSISKYFTDSHDGIPYYRGQDVNDFFLENADPYRISKDAFYKGWMHRSHFKSGDVLLSIVGTVGSLSYVTDRIKESTGSCKIAILRPGDKIDGRFLSAFLKSKYGQFQIKRNVRGAVQTGLILKDMVFIRVPEISSSDEKRISALVQKSIDENFKSKDLYTQATQLLEDALGLNNIEFKREKSYTAYASEVASTRRMNAEYFSPTVKAILRQDFFNDSQPLGIIFQIMRGTTPKEYYTSGVPVLKTKNVRVPEIDKERIADFVPSTKDLTEIRNDDLLLASMGVGSLGRMSYISNLEQSYVVDGTIRVLRPKASTPENFQIPTLLFLQSKVGQELIYRGIVGSTGIISLPDDYLKKIPIPIFAPGLCDQLTQMVLNSINAKRESKELLEQAKQEVETLIEQAALNK